MGYFDSVLPPPAAPAARTVAITHVGANNPYALAALRGEAEAVASAPEGARNDALNRAWFRLGRHIGAGNIDIDTVRATLADAARAAGLPEAEIETVLRDGSTSAVAAGAAVPRIPDPLPERPGLTVLDTTAVSGLPADEEAAFWGSRELLAHLHTYARARMVAPWAVLGVALARIITATPHAVCLPAIVGGKASLNLFVGLVGPSGSGKGAAESVAAEAVHVGPIVSHNVGSGEGIAHGYKRRVKGVLEWNDNDHAVLFSVPEIDSLAAQGDRKGSTLMPQLRSGWTGEQLGFGYADPMKRIIVEAHQYRLCLVAGIQPMRAACLLEDSDGGTPQRFLWLPATDRDAPDELPEAPAPWRWTRPALATGDMARLDGMTRVHVCEVAVDTIREARRANNRGQGDPLDGHALLTRLKTAAALGIAEGRYRVTEEDWELAGVIARKSAAVRGEVLEALRARAHAENVGRAEAEGKRAVVVAEQVADAAVRRVCGVIVRRLKRDEWASSAELRRAAASRDRSYVNEALERLEAAGQIVSRESSKGISYRLREE